MIEPDLDDTHLCIKCSATISGLENYIEHRKHGCTANHNPSTTLVGEKLSTTTADRQPQNADGSEVAIIAPANRSNLEHDYEAFSFQTEPDPPTTFVSKSEHGGKTTKALCDPYYLPYELGADVFFSSLQLQSVQSSTGPPAAATTIKSGTTSQQRLKSNSDHPEVTWIATTPTRTSDQHSTENLMKAVSDISGSKKPYDVGFKPLSFVHEGSLEPSEEELEEDEEEIDVEIDEEEDEEFDPIASSHASGGKWKPSIIRHSPPVVPLTHTGGKWKPENRPNIRITHTQLTRLSPNWEEPTGIKVQVVDSDEHPPAGHTKGKWIPGTKMQRLEYKEDAEMKRGTNLNYWCNICCRKLKSKLIYENHLKTMYHLKRAEPEQQLEKATLGDIKKDYCVLEEPNDVPITSDIKKRRRRACFIKCDLCKLTMQRHLLGKHLISHYHFRRMQLHPGKSLRMILDNIHAIVLQAPFQCWPCRFYANTEETFLLHWNSEQHKAACTIDRACNLWCSFCRFECDDSTRMLHHLLSNDHKEVILAINRSVPICISRKVSISCPICNQSFRYNAQLRKHFQRNHPNASTAAPSTASDHYQSRFQCDQCPEVLRSKVALQRHEKHRHFISKYFCAICNLEFETSCQARYHRKTQTHRLQAESQERATRRRAESINKKKGNQCKSKATNFEFDASNKIDGMLEELPASSLNVTKNPFQQHSVQSQQSDDSKEITSSKLKCKDCNEHYENHAALKTHRDAVHPLLCHICVICGQSFALPQALGRHTRKCRPKSEKESSILNLNPATEAGIPNNLRFDNERKPETATNTSEAESCEECNFSASLKSEMIFHRLHHTLGSIGNKQLIACPFCPKSFRKHSLRCHLRQHTNERIFACDFCDQKFSRLHNLKNHKKTMHSEETESKMKNVKEKSKLLENSEKVKATSVINNDILAGQCDFCGKVFRNLHSEIHNQPKKLFNCDKCSFKTRISGHLKRHMRSHTGEKPHKCPHCDFSTALRDNLRQHILKTKKHSGKFIYECNLCKTTTDMAIFKTNVHLEFLEHLAKTHELL